MKEPQPGAAAPSLRAVLIERCWRQGSILPTALKSHVRPIPFARHIPDNAIFVVVSQDCDLVHHSTDAEPAAEVIALVPIESVRSEYQNLRNPRELHLHLRNVGGVDSAVSVHIWGRGFVDRLDLRGHSPDETISLSRADLELLIDFVGRRYDREAFPDEFVRRFKRAKDGIERVLREYVDRVVDIQVTVEPFKELPQPGADEPLVYRLWIYVILPDSLVEGPPSVLNDLRTKLKGDLRRAIKKCTGILLEDIHFKGRSEITLDVLERMRRLDFDAMSYEEESRQAPGDGQSVNRAAEAPRSPGR